MSNGCNTLACSGPALPDFEQEKDPLGEIQTPLDSQVPELDLKALREQAEAALKDPRE